MIFKLLLVFGLLIPCVVNAVTTDECYEGSQFIENAALLRESGKIEGVKENFISQMFEDFEKLKSVPEELRWFVQNENDEFFILNQALKVWENKKEPSKHREEFLFDCLIYIKQ
jgi:hypothetical protein